MCAASFDARDIDEDEEVLFSPAPKIVQTRLDGRDGGGAPSEPCDSTRSKRKVPANITCHCTVCLDPDPPAGSRPIRADIRTFDFAKFIAAEPAPFDVIMMDPPWQLAGQNASRGVSLMYDQLHDRLIEDMPVGLLQRNGLIFIWVINNKFTRALDMMESWGYEYIMDVVWVKRTVNRKLAKCHGYYLQHAKETCLVGMKGTIDPEIISKSVGSDVIYSERRGQSQKPVEIYELIESLYPKGRLLEIFGRRHNLRRGWVTIGNEV